MSFARRIVPGTGVPVSAAIRPDSVPALALEKALLNFDVCVSRETLAERVTVLSRPTFDRDVPPRQRDDFAAGFRARAIVVEVTTTVSDGIDPCCFEHYLVTDS
ncbi:MAG: hypothetical protein KFB96_05930 [Thiocapsa sp.]|uniref:hypothetical protein n=1 Tax=Thiocapsa sp. TaxID=2024551 RepID=UPI001BCFD902|nr:hypothetical protein [Thiocapsa sp.]QVL50009.1 MAG: hypothetical protein KFB96_05930 [Thiocapsa sp.]